MTDIEKLSKLFRAIVRNYHTFGAVWKNMELGKQAFRLMKGLPPVVEGEFDTQEEKATLLHQMLEHMNETSTPRFCLEVREYIRSLYPDYEDNNEAIARLQDYLDPGLSMEEYCAKYGRHLKFDPVERTRQWEEVIYRVEKECDKALKDEHHYMGFCFIYWSAKQKVLKRYGIDWRSPSEMNPHVMFD